MGGNTLGVIDLGTNTALMLLGRIEPCGKVTILTDEHAIVRLGQRVDSTGLLNADAISRACKQLKIFSKKASRLGVTNLSAWGTSAVRDAINKNELIKKIYSTSGINLHILKALDEARLTFEGAAYGLNLPKRFTVIDIGGGSTEIAYGRKDEPLQQTSINIGALRLSERHQLNEENSESKIRDIRSNILKDINNLYHRKNNEPLIAVSGTALTIAALKTGCEQIFDPILHGHYIEASFVRKCCGKYLQMTSEQLSYIPAIGPGRSKIIGAGLLILDTFLTQNHFDGYLASIGGVRYGLLEELIRSA